MSIAKNSFDNKLYLKLQSESILERVEKFGKVYIEFGGKLFDDYHAARVFKGFEIDSKMSVLYLLRNKIDVLIPINANDIQKSKVRSDIGLSYDNDVLYIIDEFERRKMTIAGVVITQFANQPLAIEFKEKLDNLGIKTYLHYPIEDYPRNIEKVLSEEGFGKNDYADNLKPITIVTAPGPGSGKMAVCLSQLYNDNLHGVKSGYAKYETFPVWNLPLKHPVNLAYEAATADLNDVNMIDAYHLEAYGVSAVNYNRDIEVFPILEKIFANIYGESPYKSPTDMGVNKIGFAIVDEDAAIESSKQEIIRRYYNTKNDVKLGKVKSKALEKIELLMSQLNLHPEDRLCVGAALEKAEATGVPSVAIELNNGKIVTGKRSDLFEAESAAIINAIKMYAKIDDEMPLLAKAIIDPIQSLKQNQLKRKSTRLTLEEVLITLSINATTNAMAQKALEQLPKLNGAQMHSSIMLFPDAINTLKKLRIDVTTEPVQDTKLLQR